MSIILVNIIILCFVFGILFFELFLCFDIRLYPKEGKHHISIVSILGSCGDSDYLKLSDNELTNRLHNDWKQFRILNPCDFMEDNHICEYRYITFFGKVKTIGYITESEVVFNGKTYIFGG